MVARSERAEAGVPLVDHVVLEHRQPAKGRMLMCSRGDGPRHRPLTVIGSAVATRVRIMDASSKPGISAPNTRKTRRGETGCIEVQTIVCHRRGCADLP